MPHTIKIYREDKFIRETEGGPSDNLLSCINAAGAHIDAPCGGQGRCEKCLVRLNPYGAQILACRTAVDRDMDVYLPAEAEMEIVETGAVDSGASSHEPPLHEPPPNAKLGAAIDIGTTTVVVHLIDMNTGMRIATASGANAQRAYGADVISRIQYCVDNGHEDLTLLIRQQLSELIRQTCVISGERSRDIKCISIAANTVMEHLAAGYPPNDMGVAPFTPVDLFGSELPAWEGLVAAKTAKVYYAPAISAYFGGDAIAGMYAAKLIEDEGPTIYLDIGTNGEMAMKYGDTYYCCSTAAGPAFEGAEITFGMAAVVGAINHVKWEDGLKTSVIRDEVPRGMCGSGLVDALAVMVSNGVVDETGRLLDPEEIEGDIAEHVGKVDGKNVFWLTKRPDGVYMTALDIRKLQLAKSAIAAGIQTLIRHVGITEDQVKSFVLAGGFGSFMDQFSASCIGMFPKSFLPKTITLGNTAGEGASLALYSGAARQALDEIRERCQYIELSADPVFRDEFVEQMMFE